MSQTKPNFLCIGAQKAGTTWLYNILRHHPDVWVPPEKEIHYFDHVHLEEIDWRKKRIEQLQTALCQFSKGNFNYQRLEFFSRLAITKTIDDDYYLSLFREANKKIVADITPDYSALNEAGFAHIARLLPDVKVVFIMRNPIKRAWSQAVMRKRKVIAENKKINIKQWIKVIDNNRNYRLSNYIRTVNLCKKHFSQENVLFLIYDDICNSPLKTIEQVCEFLDIDYREDIFGKYVRKKFNSNPKYEIPIKVESFLRSKLEIQTNFVKETFEPATFEL